MLPKNMPPRHIDYTGTSIISKSQFGGWDKNQPVQKKYAEQRKFMKENLDEADCLQSTLNENQVVKLLD